MCKIGISVGDVYVSSAAATKDVVKLNGRFIEGIVDDLHVQSRSKRKGGTAPLAVTGTVHHDLSLFVHFYLLQSIPTEERLKRGHHRCSGQTRDFA